MKRTKQIFALLLAAMLALSTLTACGQKPGQDTSAPAQGGQNSEPAAPAGPDLTEEVTLDFYYVGNKEETDNDLISVAVSKITKEKINAKVNFHVFDWGSYQKKIDMMIASGEKVDIVSTVMLPFTQMVAKDSFLELDDLYAQYGKNMAQYMRPNAMKGCTIGGNLYGITTPKEDAGCYGYVIRKDLVEKANIDLSAVKTMADMTEVWKKLKQVEPGFSIYNNASGNAYISLMGYQEVGDGPGRIYRNENPTIVNEYDDPVFKETMKLWNEWYKAGYINKETTNANFAHTAALRDDKIQAIGGQCKVGIEAEVSAGIGGKYEFVKVVLEQPIALSFNGYECALSIPRTCANPERAMMFIDLLFSDTEVNNLLNFGIEGTHYVTTNDGRIKIPDGANPDTLTYNPNMVWQLGNAFISKWWTTYPVNHVEMIEEFNKIVQPSLALGFVFDPEPVKNEVAACLNVKSEFERTILSGSLAPEEYYSRMTSQYKAAGIEKVIAEKQAQLDKYLAANK